MSIPPEIPVQPVILCGGSGTRLWPLSRSGFPKQFLCLTGNESLFQQAAMRLAAIGATDIRVANPYIVSGEEHRFLALEQLRETGIPMGACLLEPIGRNTAPALTLAALAALEDGTDQVLIVTPADQTIADQAAFTRAVQHAVREAATGSIVILGIAPSQPETGYGYIQVDRSENEESALEVRRFVEKPNASTAQTYLDEGGYYWNAGMFVLKASVWMAALTRFRPDIALAKLRYLKPIQIYGRLWFRLSRPAPDLKPAPARRLADSMQFASALIAAGSNARKWGFVCLDARLSEAAEREGFNVLSDFS